MFQTEPIIWLQNLASPALTWCMTAVTTLGYAPVYVAGVLVLAFGVRMRPTLAVLVTILLSGILTESLKSALAFPRPSSVDVRVGEPGDPSPPSAVVDRGGGSDFWAPPAAEARTVFRERGSDSYGFPSGHVSTATAFLFALAVWFRRKAVLGVAAVWVPLMALSRMYLGRHFLADVLGGVAVGLVAVLAALLLLRPFERDESPRPRAAGLIPLAAVTAVLLGTTVMLRAVDAGNVGRFLGVVATYGFLVATGFPRDDGSLRRRTARVLSAALLFAAVTLVGGRITELVGIADTRAGALLVQALGVALSLCGAVAVSRRTRLYLSAASPPRDTLL